MIDVDLDHQQSKNLDYSRVEFDASTDIAGEVLNSETFLVSHEFETIRVDFEDTTEELQPGQ